MMRRTTEQITDVSRGNTAALVGIDQFLLNLGTLTTIENAHNTADTKYRVYHVAKIAVMSKDRRDSITLLTANKKNIDVIFNEMTSWNEHPQPAENLVKWYE